MADTNGEACRAREVECRTVLNKSGLTDYAVNCYTGCGHGCVYCYARFVSRLSHPGETWGSFVDVKVNAPDILAREAARKRTGTVFLSSVCDGWQPLEGKYRLTRSCLEILLRHGFPVSVLTKSKLAGRDLDLLADSKDSEFGVTVTTLDESLRQIIEPGSSPSGERLGVLQEAGRKGIRTYAFLGPLLPGLTDSEENLSRLLEAVGDCGIDYFFVDRLNPRWGVWASLREVLQKHFPHLTGAYRRILYDTRTRNDYSERLATLTRKIAVKYGIDGKMRLCF